MASKRNGMRIAAALAVIIVIARVVVWWYYSLQVEHKLEANQIDALPIGL